MFIRLSKQKIDHIKIDVKRITILMLLSTSLIPCLAQYIINYFQSMPSDLVKKIMYFENSYHFIA